MRYVGELIATVRQQTDNLDYSATTGLPQASFLQYLNDAQERIQEETLRKYPGTTFWDVEYVQDSVTGQREYPISPGDAFGLSNVHHVWYAESSRDEDYVLLDKLFPGEVSTDRGHPHGYDLRGHNIILSPSPERSSGRIKTVYPRRVDRLELRRGQITSKTLTTILLDSDTWLDSTAIAASDYLCISDFNGVVKDRNVRIVSFNSGTRTITIPSQTLLGNTGDYITLGIYTTTHSKLPEEAEKYLIAYAKWEILFDDESARAAVAGGKLGPMEQQVISTIGRASRDYQRPPMVQRDF